MASFRTCRPLVRRMPVGDRVVEAILDLVRGARPGADLGPDAARDIAWGPGPRAAQSLMLAVRARALLTGATRRRSTTSPLWRCRC